MHVDFLFSLLPKRLARKLYIFMDVDADEIDTPVAGFACERKLFRADGDSVHKKLSELSFRKDALQN